MSDLVTGDAVVLGLSPARLPSRALAVCVDLALAWGVYLVITMALLTATASLDSAALAAVQVALFLLVLIGGPVAVETLSRGRSVGKLICGLRVVREDGGPIRFRHALVRGAIGVIELQASFGLLACTASLISARGRRIGDVFAGTLVVRERVPETRNAVPVLPPAPPWLAGRLGGLDLSRVPDGLWLAIRQYLLRAPQLDAAVGRSMAERLASDVTGWTGTPVPEGVPAGAYLAGVVAERQSRDAQRAFGTGAAGGSTAAGAGAQAFAPPEPQPGPWKDSRRGPEEPESGAASASAAGDGTGGHAGAAGSEPPPAPSAPEKRETPRTGFVPPS